MPRSSARGYVEPIAALAAVFAVAVGLTLYAGTLQSATDRDGRAVATTVLESLSQEGATLGVIRPNRLRLAPVPAGWSANLTLVSPAGRWTAGGVPPDDARRASKRVAVRLDPGRVRPGRLRVAIWR
jgi:hypothetical protein